MGADQKIDLAGFQSRENIAALLALFAAGENGDAQPGALGQRRNGLDVLPCKDFRWCHQRRLLADFGDCRRRQQRHHRLAGADIAL